MGVITESRLGFLCVVVEIIRAFGKLYWTVSIHVQDGYTMNTCVVVLEIRMVHLQPVVQDGHHNVFARNALAPHACYIHIISAVVSVNLCRTQTVNTCAIHIFN